MARKLDLVLSLSKDALHATSPRFDKLTAGSAQMGVHST
jgi:hypothetical protein